MKLRLVNPEVLVPDARLCAEAASRGIEALVIDHLREKNRGTQPNRNGLPKTNYYAEASNNVEASTNGSVAVIAIDHPGISIHYEGGTVRPKKKALAIPIDPSVSGIWPSEYDQNREKTFITAGGAIGDKESGKILYILLPRADIPADQTVLPTDDAILHAAEEEITEAFS